MKRGSNARRRLSRIVSPIGLTLGEIILKFMT